MLKTHEAKYEIYRPWTGAAAAASSVRPIFSWISAAVSQAP